MARVFPIKAKSAERNTAFDSNGAGYAATRPSYPPILARWLSEQSIEHELAVDVGCGSGQLTRLLPAHFDRVIGIDSSADQIAHAPTAAKLSYTQGTAARTGLPDSCADLITAAQAAHWFDLGAFYSELRRIAKPQAVLALVCYGVPSIQGPVNAVFQEYYWHKLHEFWPPERAQVESGYAELPMPFPSIEAPSFCMRRPLSAPQFIGYVRTWSAYFNADENGRRRFETLFSELRRAWGEQETVVWPLTIRAGRVDARPASH